MKNETTNIRQYFSFGKSEEYPSGFVSISKENVEALKGHGWDVDFHTDYFLNNLGVSSNNGLVIGCSGWMDNLSFYMCEKSYGEYDGYYEEISIRSQEQLDTFVDLIESMFQFQTSMKYQQK